MKRQIEITKYNYQTGIKGPLGTYTAQIYLFTYFFYKEKKELEQDVLRICYL